MLSSYTATAATADPFDAVQQAWVLHNAAGLSLQPGAARSIGSTRGFSVAVWFRLDDAGVSNPTKNAVLQLVLGVPSTTYNVTLTLSATYAHPQSLKLSLLAKYCCSATGGATSDADYAVSTSTDEFQPPPNNRQFSVGTWQHVMYAFGGSGVQSGLFWNGVAQQPALGWAPVDLGALIGGAPPYAPVTGGAVGYDLSSNAFLTPLWGAVGDIQVYDFAVSQAMAQGLYTSQTAGSCTATPPQQQPPLPPAPPGGFSPPPPSPPPPPSRPPLAPRELLSTETLNLCIPGLSTVQVLEYERPICEGVGSFLGLAQARVRVLNVTTGCLAPPPPVSGRRRLLQAPNATAVNVTVNGTAANGTAMNASSVHLELTYVAASIVSGKIEQLYDATNGTLLLTQLSAALNTALTAAGLPPLISNVSMVGSQVVVPRAPPPPFPPPLPPGVTPATQLAAANADKHTNRGPRWRESDTGAAVAYALAAIVVLWFPVHCIVHAVTSAHKRRTAVSVAVAVRCEPGLPRGARLSTAAASEKGGGDADDDEFLAGKRFGAPQLAGALAASFMRAAAAASAADALPSPREVALRPLLRKPMVTALDASLRSDGESGHLALRKKPTSALWRLKRWILSELHWQGRELRHAWRALRRCCGSRARSHDPVGKAFRLVPAPAAEGDARATNAVLFETTWFFGWRGRDGAACWRRQLRDGALLATLEQALASELAGAAGLEVTLVQEGNAATVALLDDEPHANLDKKRHTTTAAPSAKAAAGTDRTVGVAPAVAERLEVVLALCAVRGALGLQPPRASMGELASTDAASADATV
jgi:hypothetical protein